MLDRPTSFIGPDERDAFRRDGAIVLRNIIGQDWLTALDPAFDEALARPGPFVKDYADPGEGSYRTDHHPSQRVEAFQRFLFDGPLAQAAAELMESDEVRVYDEHLLIKEPGTTVPTYWHHDLPYFNISGDDIVSFWFALDPVTQDTGAIRFATGSHSWGELYLPIRIGKGDAVKGAENETDIAGPVPDIDADPERYPTVTWDLEPGDCVVFHGRTLHASGGNKSADVRRRALSIRFIGDDIRWKNREFGSLVFETPMNDGDVLDRPECPKVWPLERS